MNEELIDFCTWLSKKGYLNGRESVEYFWDEQWDNEYVLKELEPEEVLEEYEQEKKDGNII